MSSRGGGSNRGNSKNASINSNQKMKEEPQSETGSMAVTKQMNNLDMGGDAEPVKND